jgi:hypothetical protein
LAREGMGRALHAGGVMGMFSAIIYMRKNR